MIGAFLFGRLASKNTINYIQNFDLREPDLEFLEAEKARIYASINQPEGIPRNQVGWIAMTPA